MKASYPPAFLYEDPAEYDPDDDLGGLMRGYFLVRVRQILDIGNQELKQFQCFRAIFLGPKMSVPDSSEDQAPTRSGVMRVYGLSTVTAPMIVYTAVQVG